jgi:hypothetical protein
MLDDQQVVRAAAAQGGFQVPLSASGLPPGSLRAGASRS